MPSINPARLMAELKHLRTFGAEGTGVVRPSLSPVDMASRRWLHERMIEAGLDACIDGVGNVIGHSRNPGKALLVGSHSDTQPRGGWLDGALGVIYGLEIVRAFAEDPATLQFAVDAVAWIDEEGTYLGCLGSRSFCGVLTTEAIESAANADGYRLTEAITAAAVDGVPPARLEPARYVGYLEAHIEQGPYLEAADHKIGVVTSIVGIRGCRIQFRGQQNHAGTTPMPNRKDAGVGLIDFAYKLRPAFHPAPERQPRLLRRPRRSGGAGVGTESLAGASPRVALSVGHPQRLAAECARSAPFACRADAVGRGGPVGWVRPRPDSLRTATNCR